jgi:hypothetical protein
MSGVEINMNEGPEKILVHFYTSQISVYKLKNKVLSLLQQECVGFGEVSTLSTIFNEVDKFLYNLNTDGIELNNINVRLYATGVFQNLSQADAVGIINQVYVNHGLSFNIIDFGLEKFYVEMSRKIFGLNDMMKGLISQEFRRVVICGSFQQSLKHIDKIIAILKKHNIEVLSPASTRIKPETLGTKFIMFDYQDYLQNERDTWRHKYIHMDKFREADACIVCNPSGVVGEGTMFEFGFMIAMSQRIIFSEVPNNLSILFPYEVGLNFN